MKNKVNSVVNFNNMKVDKLSHHITSTFHVNLKKTLNTLPTFIKGLAISETEKQIDVSTIEILFAKLINLLMHELDMEETVFFPYIDKLVEIEKGNTSEIAIPDKPREDQVNKIQIQHKKIKVLLMKIREAANDYKSSGSSSPGLKLCFAHLFNLEQDVHKHIFLEENILFPKIAELEKRILNSKKQNESEYKGS